MEKDQYLYVDLVDGQIWRLNITNLGRGEGSEFECVWKFDPRGQFPTAMRCMRVSSKLYMIGGQIESWRTIPPASDDDEDDVEFVSVPNLDIFEVGLNGKYGLTLSDFPRTGGPKTAPIVVFLDEKIYVLAVEPFHYLHKSPPQPVFEVFEPVNGAEGGSWKVLSSLPWEAKDPRVIIYHYYWGHKIVIVSPYCSYVFDTWTEKWEPVSLYNSSPRFPVMHRGGVEFQGFLITMSNGPQQLVAYQLYSNGIPNMGSYRVLDELRSVFNPPFDRHDFEGWTIHLGGDKFCFLFSGLDYWDYTWCARVAIFRVSIQCSAGGQSFPFACLETLQCYDLQIIARHPKIILSVFVMCHDLDKHDDEADSSFTDANLSGLDSGDDSKRAAEYMEGYVVSKKLKNSA